MRTFEIPVRVLRDGSYQNLDVADLTDEEVNKFFCGMERDRLLAWVKGLLRALRHERGETNLEEEVSS